jgi:serine acetyltransferase
MKTQFSYLMKDISRILGTNKYRIIILIFTRAFWAVFIYRIERQFYLIFKKFYPIIRIPFVPILSLIQSFSNTEINYKADIKGGILILHPSVGVVISSNAIIGENLTLTGGNIIGIKNKNSNFLIGNNCSLGANAVIIGPLILGNNIEIGALACVTKSFLKNSIKLVGVPATEIKPDNE